MRINIRAQAVFLILAMGLIGVSLSLPAAVVRPGAPALAAAWAQLDAGRAYRQDFDKRLPGVGKTHSMLIRDYTSASVTAYPGKTPKQLFIEAAVAFENAQSNPGLAGEATLGLQESLNEIMAGQSLLGNNDLIKGLRVRFPISTDDKGSQTFYLRKSAIDFQTAIDRVVEVLRRDPGSLRAGSTLVPQFPFRVENTVRPGSGQGESVESEFYRFTDLVDLSAMARISLGKRLFFFGDAKDEDNEPYYDFPGEQDLDLNGDGIQNFGDRQYSALELKRAAQATYLHSAVLAAVQTPKQFDDNNGYQLKRQILDANRIFEDILAGFNPLQLLGDFVPFQRVENFLGSCTGTATLAQVDEEKAAAAARSYDQDDRALRDELRNEQTVFIDEIESLTGLALVDSQGKLLYDLMDPLERDRLLADADVSAEQGYGTLGGQLLAIEEAAIEAKQAEEVLRQIPEKIRIEQRRNGQVAMVTAATGATFAALSLAESFASMCTVTVGTLSGVTCNLNAPMLGQLRAERDWVAAMSEIRVSGINSVASIKQYLLDQVLALIAVERAGNIIEQQQARYNELLAQLQRTVRSYVAARVDLADAYFANPAYRLARDINVETAEASFATAMEECYIATKALEYLWSDRFSNPIPRLDAGLPKPLPGTLYDRFVRAESVFAVQNAADLAKFPGALKAWDLEMQQLRSPGAQQSTSSISLRRDILGFNGGDEALNRLLFKDFIAKHRVPGRNSASPDLVFEFGIEIADQKLFPDHPNIKINEIRINLVSSPARSIAAAAPDARPAKVDLVMLDEAVVRTFFAEPPDDDDLITYDLQQGRSLSKSPFLATIDATIDGYSFPAAAPNAALEGHSPAVTRWTLRMRMDQGDNQYLLLENLDDILITFSYSFGKPRQVMFP